MDNHKRGDEPNSMMAMMVMMMAMCFGMLLLFAVIPSVGWPAGILLGIGAGSLMLILHRRYMRHG